MLEIQPPWTLNSFGAKFQTIFVICFFILTNYRLIRRLYLKLKDWMSNSIDPDETAKACLLPVAVKELKCHNCSWQHLINFLLFSIGNKSWHFMWIFCMADNSHETSRCVCMCIWGGGGGGGGGGSEVEGQSGGTKGGTSSIAAICIPNITSMIWKVAE